MKSKKSLLRAIKVVLAMAILSCFCAIFFTACGDDTSTTGTDKQVPIYQGMTISSTQSKAATKAQIAKAASATTYASVVQGASLYDQESNISGGYPNDMPYYGDYNGRNEDINQNKPFGDNSQTIENEIKDTLTVVGSAQDLYYATANQDIYITIHISNPDSFEIVSFVLNDTKYPSYQFKDGSDLENIVLKVNVGDAVGYLEYTIDEIKYIDGTEIKDVLIDGNETVNVGVYTSNQPQDTITDENISYNSVTFNVSITDKYSLIEKSNGSIKAVIYDGDDVISQKDLGYKRRYF
jgi:hypothetical protein